MSAYGPSLPPHLQKRKEQDKEEAGDSSGSDEEEPPLGPALPPHLRKARGDFITFKGGEEDAAKSDEEAPLGPALPPHLARNAMRSAEESDDDDGGGDAGVIGPLPPGAITSCSSVRAEAAREAEAAARRSQHMLDKQRGKDSEPTREGWMLELPEEKAKSFGMGPRQFSKSTADKAKRDHSWTDTPEMKAKRARGDLKEDNIEKKEDADVLEYLASLKRDQEMEKISQELKAKRGSESLMDTHTKKIKKKKQAEELKGPAERRPFDRDLDLQVNRFDEAAKKRMLKKARQLDDRFSKGASKYL